MLEPKDKAKELVDKYTVATWIKLNEIKYLTTIPTAHECALIAVDELLQDHLQDQTDTKFYYWQEVKKQIELL